ncbi:MAG TPA: hypothetical protein VHL78_03640, partial [Actinomycetota bacterium]|nr:hypothetical protein [Actinomycetota bacterium]
SRSTAELRERLARLAHTLRRDAGQAAPWGDPGIASGGRWRRRFKIVLHRLVRPVSRRYDRVTAELAETGVSLADALLRAEAEVERLRQEVRALRGEADGP